MAYSNPPYRKNKKGEAFVSINRRPYMLGTYGTPESLALYKARILEWGASGRSPMFGRTVTDITLAEIMLGYREHLLKEVAQKGPTSEANRALNLFKHIPKVYRSFTVNEFKLDQLRAVRHAMIDRKLSRKTINGEIRRILRMFTWATTENYCTVEACATLFQISTLKPGEFGVKELPEIGCVSPKIVLETIKYCSPVVADMVLLQMKTGCRSGELLNLRPMDINCNGEFWVADLKNHKTKWRGKKRFLAFDVSCQKILKKYLNREPAAYLFQPCESEEQRRALKHRKTPQNSGNSPGYSKRVREGRTALRQPGDRFTSQAYGKAIRYACERAFPTPSDVSPAEAKRWRESHHWTPHQLRHNAATLMKQEFGSEASTALLGHSKLDTTSIYAENTKKMAIDAARKFSTLDVQVIDSSDFSSK